MDDADAVRRSSGCTPEVTLDGGRAHVQGLGDLSNGETLASKFTKTIHVEPNARASDSRTTAACLRHAGFRSLDQTSAFLLSDPTENRDEQASHGAARVEPRLTQRGLRRTFNDLARTARVDALVTRSISGHLTERMQHHYSTVNSDEQRQGIAKVIELTKAREKRQVEASDADDGSGGAPGGAPGAAGGAL
jgi:predicted TIM-barrel fold metal-dependent hydrolase